ncbi:MAG: hypothetical protein HY894_04240 [Deltaproteobacteria bacterium]|nr:hypothetical protein [Deltaproteobacteria bacterium]
MEGKAMGVFSKDGKDSFEALVEKCRSKRLPTIIYNASKDHAEALCKNLLQVAVEERKDVRIVSGNLDSDFYGRMEADVRKALETGCKVDLIVLNAETDLSNNAFAKAVRQMNGNVLQQSTGRIVSPHFMLVGKELFRIEKDHEQAKAIASFNNPDIGETLFKYFDEVKAQIK